MTLDELKILLPLLKTHNVKEYKTGELELSFLTNANSPNPKSEVQAPLTAVQTQNTPDFRADDLMSFDKVLHWSGSGDTDPDQLPLPLIGEALVAP